MSMLYFFITLLARAFHLPFMHCNVMHQNYKRHVVFRNSLSRYSTPFLVHSNKSCAFHKLCFRCSLTTFKRIFSCSRFVPLKKCGAFVCVCVCVVKRASRLIFPHQETYIEAEFAWTETKVEPVNSAALLEESSSPTQPIQLNSNALFPFELSTEHKPIYARVSALIKKPSL